MCVCVCVMEAQLSGNSRSCRCNTRVSACELCPATVQLFGAQCQTGPRWTPLCIKSPVRCAGLPGALANDFDPPSGPNRTASWRARARRPAGPSARVDRLPASRFDPGSPGGSEARLKSIGAWFPLGLRSEVSAG